MLIKKLFLAFLILAFLSTSATAQVIPSFNTIPIYDYQLPITTLTQNIQSNTAGTTFQTTKYTYNVSNQVLTITDPLGRVTTFTYDADENLSSKKDPKGNLTSYTYDERNLLFKVTDANNGVTQYNYDGNGNLAEVLDAKSNATKYAYTGFDQQASTTYADSSIEKYTYDKDSDLTQKITAAAQTITYTYDALNRLTAVTYPATTTLNITRTYDAGSRLLTANNGYSKITYTYDALNRVTDESEVLGSETYPVKSAYDKAGNRTSVTYPSGKVIGYTYNALNLVSGVTVNGVALGSYAYDTLNRLTTKTLASTTSQSSVYTYDAGNELTNLTNKLTTAGTVISGHTYTYDADRNRATYVNQEGTVSTTADYTYDKINQLTAVSGAQTHSYAYDTVGNRTTADSVAYTSNDLNQYTEVGGSALTYDKNGNMLTQPGISYTYDAENRQIGMTKGSTTATYTYDAFNRRVSKTVSGVVTYYVYDGDQTIEEHNASGTLNADYEYGPNIDEVLTMNRGGTTYYYQYDGLGSVRNLTNASGGVVETYDYDVYGNPTKVSTVGNPVMFTGRWYDTESGNYYYRAREYSPTYGRFLQRDLIGYYNSMNLYQYVKNNPTNYIDPYGLWNWYKAWSNGVGSGITGSGIGLIYGGEGIWAEPVVGGILGFAGGFISGGLDNSPLGNTIGGAISGANDGFRGMVTGAAGENEKDLIDDSLNDTCPLKSTPKRTQILWDGFIGISAGVSAAALAYEGMELSEFYAELLTGGVSGLGFGLAGASATMIISNYFSSQSR